MQPVARGDDDVLAEARGYGIGGELLVDPYLAEVVTDKVTFRQNLATNHSNVGSILDRPWGKSGGAVDSAVGHGSDRRVTRALVLNG